ncbi:SCO family protein [Bradyrhizobium sp. 139]|uniref:SCO family protein n=1 Tax=Bradyrhizobium sp. 139 TaxID=2782616 RepID=UPI001FFA29AA|nr:SCO family protein [Bradyrhizobium sp. 139]MCK1745655.1 SCO family protein [Bradyrhizobium sp. 139]
MSRAGRWFGLWLALTSAWAGHAAARSAAETMDILMWNREPVGGPFALTDHTGKARTDRDFRGELMLVYFGFTYCPDVCPTDLMAIGQTLDLLGADAEKVQPLFITVDPERDTAEHLADYVTLFHPRLIGLTGGLDAIREAADAYKVYFAKVATGKGDANYTVDHTAYIYLMDRDGKYLGFFPPGTSAERMLEIIRPRLAAPQR